MSLYVERARTGVLRVSECFGPTIQGEGPATGRAAAFLRLGGCNLSCSWCDTPYTWDATRFDLLAENPIVPVGTVVERVLAAAGKARLLVLTGGEPIYSQGADLYDVLDDVRAAGIEVHVESNGTLAPSPALIDRVDHFVLSPKLGNAGPHRGRQDPELHPVWRALNGMADFQLDMKFVVRTPEDVDQAAAVAASALLPPDRVWLMPEGITPDALAERWRWVCETAAERGFNASHRLHVLAWGDKRGH